MAMHDPCAGVVSLEGNHHVTVGRDQDDITSCWVFQLEVAHLRVFRGVVRLVKDCKVMTMEMNLAFRQWMQGDANDDLAQALTGCAN